MDVVEDIFNRLCGRWELQRDVAGFGKFTGVCSFVEDGPWRLICREDGRWSEEASGLEAFRAYIYEFDAAQSSVTILYNDPQRKGDVLHKLNFRKNAGCWEAGHRHICGDDQYDLWFKMEKAGCVFMNYTIFGPRKNYRIKTVLTKAVS